jgi:hypothetical protein
MFPGLGVFLLERMTAKVYIIYQIIGPDPYPSKPHKPINLKPPA